MHCNPGNGRTTPRERPDRPSESAAVSRAAWHRPAIAIIDVKRTMLVTGRLS
jgi:hypothetical protein